MRKRIAEGLGWVVVIGALGVLGWVLIATAFMVYDDEGYVLMSVRQFSEGKPLYTEVYSQYGPAFFLFYRGLNALTGIAYNHEVGRLLTLGYWVASAAAAGGLTRRLTTSVAAGWAAAVLGFVALSPNINEPFHPGSLLALLSVVATWAGAECVLRNWSKRMGLVLGALGALGLLIKVNVGVFLFCAWGSWWLAREVKGSRWEAWTGWIVGAGVVGAPLLLMRKHLGEAWALGFAWVFIASALGVWSQAGRSREINEARAGWGWLGAAGVVLAGVLVSMAWLGTWPAALWEGGVMAPLRHPQVYTYPAKITLWQGGLTWTSLGILWWVMRKPVGVWRTTLITAVRVAGLAGYFWQAKDPISNGDLYIYAFSWGPLLAAWMLTPLTELPSAETRARWWLGWVFVWQILQAYPVAGTQVAWGSVLWVVIASIGCVDLWKYWGRRWHWAPATGALAWCGMAFATAGVVTMGAQSWWADSSRLELPGARWLRPPPDLVRTLQVLQTNLQRDAGIVFSVPGLLSFNLWSGRPTPTAANATHWFSLLNDQQQTEIIKKLEEDPRAMVVVQRDLLGFLYREGFGPTGRLSDYLRTAFVPAIRLGSYDLCIKRGRQIAAYNTFRVEAGRLTAWVVRDSGPTTVYLCNPAHPSSQEILLTGLTWSQQDGPIWRVEAPLPEGWPITSRREMRVGEERAQIILENTLPGATALITP